jgi:hypothetical protein
MTRPMKMLEYSNGRQANSHLSAAVFCAAGAVSPTAGGYSHSMVPGGLLVMS